MRKIKILGIAPFAGIKILMESIAQKRTDIELDVYIGNMENGLSIASKYYSDGYDIIISRGGTAELIEKAGLLPVVSIETTVYDIFRSIRLASTSRKKYALIGFPSITQNAIFLREMLQAELPVFTVHNTEHAKDTLAKAARDGYDLIICDMTTHALADENNFPSILINSGEESIIAAFDLAVQIVTQRLALSDENSLYTKIIENAPSAIAIYDGQKTLSYYSAVSPLPEHIGNLLRNKIDSVLLNGPQKFYFEYSGLIYSIHAKKISVSGNPLVTYYINSRKVPLNLRKNGIRYSNLEQAQNDYRNSFCCITNRNVIRPDLLGKYLGSNLPIAVIGTPGSGKTAMINYIYSRSPRSNAPMSVIDCSRMSDKMWTFLTDNDNSPLSDTDTTIYFKNMDALTDAQYTELVDLIDDLKLSNRNLILFTFHTDGSSGLPPRDQQAVDKLHCLSLTTSPLEDNLSDLPNMISLYINHLNLLYGKNIVSIEAEAIRLLQSFHWTYSYDQIMRVLNELVLSASTSVIQTESVRQILKKEMLTHSFSPVTGQADFSDMTLEEIELFVIKQTLAKENGNQSRAAAKLGISRTTLWRMLQRDV